MSITNTKYTELVELVEGESIRDIIEALATYSCDNKMNKEWGTLFKAWKELT